MHVPWGWIKQRPHFFAEKLSHYFDVDVYGRESLSLKGNTQAKLNKERNIKYFPLYNSGYIRSKAWKKNILDWMYKQWLGFQIKNISKYKYIWITNIWFFYFIKDKVKHNQVLIYDCMDDTFEFPYTKSKPDLVEFYHRIEKELVQRADILIFSAKYLSDKIFQRSPYDKKNALIVNNAIELPKVNKDIVINEDITSKLKDLDSLHPCLLYIGTIAPWFDFEIFKDIFASCPKLTLVLIGPTEIEIPVCKNIKYFGPIERKYIFSFMERADALCMPFQVTELIRSVNPVKLYEYLYSGKPVIAPWYGETEQFQDYVYLYKNSYSFIELCKAICAGTLKPKTTLTEAMAFVKSNTWDIRMEKIIEVMRRCHNSSDKV